MIVAILTAVVAALAVGLVVAVVLLRGQRAASRQLTAELRAEAQSQRDAGVQAAIDAVVSVANERLGAQVSASAGHLDTKKGLIDQQLAGMRSELDKIVGLVQELEAGRENQYGQLTEQIRAASRQTTELADTTRQLREALSSTTARGQWGERMAEDVLSLAGFLEGVNYRKQATTDTGGRPDFTFLLPRGLFLHMDVKFPLSNYLRYLEADSDTERDRHRAQFLRDARTRVKELAARDYLEADDTIECLLLFIPNEQVYGFIQAEDPDVMEQALRAKIVLCSPLTLYAVLAVIRQAVDNFQLERASDEILTHLGTFQSQWDKFTEALEKLGSRLESTQRAFEEVNGARRRQLERPLGKLEDLRRDRGLPAADAEGELIHLAR